MSLSDAKPSAIEAVAVTGALSSIAVAIIVGALPLWQAHHTRAERVEEIATRHTELSDFEQLESTLRAELAELQNRLQSLDVSAKPTATPRSHGERLTLLIELAERCNAELDHIEPDGQDESNVSLRIAGRSSSPGFIRFIRLVREHAPDTRFRRVDITALPPDADAIAPLPDNAQQATVAFNASLTWPRSPEG